MLHFNAVPEPVKALLERLSGAAVLGEFSLGGGTSLALRFGHRVSVDLDFFTVAEFSPDELLEQLRLPDAEIIGRARNSLTLDVGGVKLDLLRHAYPMLDAVERIEGVALISLSDLAAMKLNAIANRGAKKDFYDLCELLNHFALSRMLGFFAEKYPATDSFSVIRSLAWFDDAEQEPDPVSLVGQEWEQVKARVCAAVAGL